MTAVNLNRAIRGPVTAVPVVAGKGVRIVPDLENNRFVVEADETVLWENDGTTSSIISDTNLTLSESVFNFERVKIYYLQSYGNGGLNQSNTAEGLVLSGSFQVGVYPTYGDSSGNMCMDQNAFTFLDTATTTCTVKSGTKRIHFANSNGSYGSTASRGITPFKIVGVNRIASN